MTASGYPYDIAAGSDGALWFTESNGDKIGRITTSGTITEWGLPAGSSPYGIAAGPDGALWFAEIGRYRIGRITTSGSITEWSLPAGSGNPAGIAAGPDGALWFTEEGVNSKIGRITTSGDISEWGLSSASRDPAGIAAGPDGALWFTVRDGNKIGRVTTSGDISEWGLSSASRDPAGIAAGPDGALWFAEHNGYRIGKAVIQFTVNASVSGGHGTVTEATQTVDYSSSATIHITPDIGYHIAGITDNGAPATVADPYVINNVTADHDVEVTFALDLYTFYFAEGTCRPGFDPYICVQNPGDTAADVKITYMLGNSTTSEQTFSVNPSSRSTISVKAHLGEGDDEAHDFSAKVETVNDTRIIAERPMYFNYGEYGRVGTMWWGPPLRRHLLLRRRHLPPRLRPLHLRPEPGDDRGGRQDHLHAGKQHHQ